MVNGSQLCAGCWDREGFVVVGNCLTDFDYCEVHVNLVFLIENVYCCAYSLFHFFESGRAYCFYPGYMSKGKLVVKFYECVDDVHGDGLIMSDE